MRKILLTAGAIVALAGAAQAGPNLVKNGSFEQNNLTPTSLDGFKAAHPGINVVGVQVDGHLPGFGNTVTDWSSDITGPYSAGYNRYFFDGDSPDGEGVGAFMVLDGDPNFTSPFQQSISGLTVGQQYNLQFYWAGGELSNRTGFETIKLTGSFGASAFTTETFNNTKPVGITGDFSGWRLEKFSFKATSTSQLLSFLAAGTPANNLPPVAFLDGVSLTAVPEPATWAIMLMGFAGLGAALRARRRAVA